MTGDATRRQFLGTAGLAGAVVTAGCSRLRSVYGGDLQATATAEFRRGPRRLGYQPDATVPDAVTKAWRVPGLNVGDHTASKSSPVPTGGGDLVLAGDTGDVHAVTPGGGLNWVAATFPSRYGVHATPAVANGTVYVGAYDGALYAFDVASGERQWRTKLGDAIGGSPAYHDGTVYTVVEHVEPEPAGSLVAVDAATGDVAFRDDRVTDLPHSTPGIDHETGTLSIGANDGFLYTWEFPSMEFAWRFDAGGEIKSPIAVYDGAAFFGSWSESVFRVDLASGTEDWRFETGGDVMSAPAIHPDDGVVYVGSFDRYVYALDAATGDELWRFETNDGVMSGIVVTDGHVLVGSLDTGLYAVDRVTGEAAWHVANRGQITCEPLVHDGAIYYTERANDQWTGGAYKLVPSDAG